MASQPLVVADDEPRITKLVAIALVRGGIPRGHGDRRRGGPREGGGGPPRHGPAGHRDARHRRHRGHGPAARGRAVPVILLTAKGSTADKAKGLDLGADDYIAKPFHPDELAARIRAVIRRSSGVEPGAGVLASTTSRSTSSGGWSCATASSSSCRGPSGCCCSTWPRNAGKVVLHTELLTKVWGPEYRDDLQYLRVWVSRVRRKLGAKPGEPGRIKTFQGIGYLLDVDAPGGDTAAEGDSAAERA